MRKCLRVLLLSAVFTALLCGSALAADNSGIKDGTMKAENGANVALEAQDAGGATVTSDGTVFPNAVQVKMTVNDAEDGKQYLAFVLDDNTNVPTVKNIVYIDQVPASGTSAAFQLYPSSLANNKTYNIWLSSNKETGGTLSKVGSFQYYASYMLGDVNEDGTVDPNDALLALDAFGENVTLTEKQTLAADVDLQNGITPDDALAILDFYAENITDFAEIQGR